MKDSSIYVVLDIIVSRCLYSFSSVSVRVLRLVSNMNSGHSYLSNESVKRVTFTEKNLRTIPKCFSSPWKVYTKPLTHKRIDFTIKRDKDLRGGLNRDKLISRKRSWDSRTVSTRLPCSTNTYLISLQYNPRNLHPKSTCFYCDLILRTELLGLFKVS